MVTITSGLGNLGSFTFSVTGITNPGLAVQTGYFTIRSYQQDSSSAGGFTFVENSDVTLTVTPQPGTLSAITMTPAVSVVGTTTTVTVSLLLGHSLPVDRIISITLPKWNSFATTTSLMQSFISVSTSPSYVNCNPLTGTTTDILSVSMSTDATAAIPAATQLTFQVLNFKTPPSLAAITSILFQTTDTSGNLIDQSVAKSITYQATQQATIPSQYIQVSATTDQTINKQTTLQLSIKNLNPIQAGSTLIITIPTEIDCTLLTGVAGQGGRIQNSPTFTISSDKHTITLKQFNSAYLEPLVNIYVNLATVKNPTTTVATSSFSVTFVDPSGNNVESVTSGVTYSALPGTITGASVTANNKLINYQNVQYKFTFSPQQTINTNAIIKITFPDQITLTNRQSQRITSVSSQLSSSAQVTVTSNKYAVITNAFTTSYNPSTSGALSLTLDGVTNPALVTTTSSFFISIYYTETTNVICTLSSGLTFTASPNTNIAMSVNLQSTDTGFNNILQFYVDTGSYPVSKGSSLLITIPLQFEIYDYTVAATSCLQISGFSDEVQCQFNVANSAGHQLYVTNGFNSETFTGGVFSFNISQVRNPKTTLQTATTSINIYDGLGNLQYQELNAQSFAMTASAFQYAAVSSNNSMTGQSSVYTFTLTLSVDTPTIYSDIQVYLPGEITYDTSKPLICRGILNLNKTLSCIVKNNKVFVLTVNSDKNNVTYIANGTSISFQLGWLFNPISFQQSSSFQVVTFQVSNSGTAYYYMNSESSSLKIQNTQRGNISNLTVSQYGQELNSGTSLRFKFSSLNSIPQNSKVVITLPSNLNINNTSSLVATLNNQPCQSLSLSTTASQLTIPIPSTFSNLQQFDINITNGVLNPWTAPYTYDTFIIELQSSLSFSIDQISVTSGQQLTDTVFNKSNPFYAPVTVKCTSNCSTCAGTRSKCLSCSYDSVQNISFYFDSTKSTCNSQCLSGFYGESSNFTCSPCQYPCQECIYGPSLCSRCYSNYSMPYASATTLQCYSQCPSGTYLDQTQSLCIQCKSPCYTCTDANTCLSCDRVSSSNPFINYYNNKCYDTCPSGTVASPQSSVCLDCTFPCKTCQDGQPDYCQTCASGYYLLKSSTCVSTCPTQYLANDKTMNCDFQGEMVFPLPFSILTVVFGFGLFVARFMKNQTRFCITLLTFTDIVLKCNWAFLLIYLYIGNYLVSASIIAYCLGMSLFSNLLIWRTLFYRLGLEKDREYLRYTERYPWTSKLLLFSSFIFSFHIFRLSYSRLLGKKQFSAQFHKFSSFVRLMSGMTLFTLIFICSAGVVANAYNLSYTKSTEQVFYLDLDGLILVSFECILVVFVVRQGEKVAMSNATELLKSIISGENAFEDKEGEEVEEEENVDEKRRQEQQKIDDAINQINRHSLVKKHFGKRNNNYQDLEESENAEIQSKIVRADGELNDVAKDYSKNIFKNLYKQFQTQTSGQTNSQKYFSQNNFAFLDLEEYRKLKAALKQLKIDMKKLQKLEDTQRSKKNYLEGKLNGVQNENQQLLSEEERLKLELEEQREKLRLFKEVTAKELEDMQNMRREQIKHRMKISKLKQFIADTVLQKGKQLLQERKQKEEEEREKLVKEMERREEEKRRLAEEEEQQRKLKMQQRPSFLDPTLSSMMKDSQTNIVEELKQTTVSLPQEDQQQQQLRHQQKMEKTFSPHRAKPPLAQRDRSANDGGEGHERKRSTVADRGPKFLNNKNIARVEKDEKRLSVANNYTGFRSQSEMRNQRNISNINSNVISQSNSPERRFIQTPNDIASRNDSPFRGAAATALIQGTDFGVATNNFMRGLSREGGSPSQPKSNQRNQAQNISQRNSMSPGRRQNADLIQLRPTNIDYDQLDQNLEQWINDQDHQFSLDDNSKKVSMSSPGKVRIQSLISPERQQQNFRPQAAVDFNSQQQYDGDDGWGGPVNFINQKQNNQMQQQQQNRKGNASNSPQRKLQNQQEIIELSDDNPSLEFL